MASISSFISVVNQHVEMKGWDLPHWRGKMNIGFSLTLVALSSMSAFETKDFKWHDMKYVMGKAIGKKKKKSCAYNFCFNLRILPNYLLFFFIVMLYCC